MLLPPMLLPPMLLPMPALLLLAPREEAYWLPGWCALAMIAHGLPGSSLPPVVYSTSSKRGNRPRGSKGQPLLDGNTSNGQQTQPIQPIHMNLSHLVC
jgi:hypothetical protein